MKFLTLDPDKYDSFLRIYNASFPAEERRPYRNAAALDDFIKRQNGRFAITAAIDDNDALLGFITLWQLKDGVTYVEHFAVDETSRGHNIGSRLLAHVLATSPYILLEVERPEDDLTRRRISFYQRHGFTLHTDYPYFQPPYATGLNSVPLLLMTRGALLPTPELVADLHHTVYKI